MESLHRALDKLADMTTHAMKMDSPKNKDKVSQTAQNLENVNPNPSKSLDSIQAKWLNPPSPTPSSEHELMKLSDSPDLGTKITAFKRDLEEKENLLIKHFAGREDVREMAEWMDTMMANKNITFGQFAAVLTGMQTLAEGVFLNINEEIKEGKNEAGLNKPLDMTPQNCALLCTAIFLLQPNTHLPNAIEQQVEYLENELLSDEESMIKPYSFAVQFMTGIENITLSS